VATYGAVWIYKKIVILLKKLKHKENINPWVQKFCKWRTEYRNSANGELAIASGLHQGGRRTGYHFSLWWGSFSRPAIAAESKPHVGIAERARKLIVINGCQNECAKKIAENLGILGISYDAYLNLEYDLGIEKIGSFTTLQYSHDDVERVNESIRNMLRQLRKQKW